MMGSSHREKFSYTKKEPEICQWAQDIENYVN